MDPAEIERLRENSRIRLDRDGVFWHEGELVAHPRVALAFHKGLGRAPDGRPTLTIGRTWCYIEADDALYRVRSAACEESDERLASCLLRLDDDSEESLPLGPGALSVGADGVLYARVKAGAEWARCSPEAQRVLGRYLHEDPAGLKISMISGAYDVPSR